MGKVGGIRRLFSTLPLKYTAFFNHPDFFARLKICTIATAVLPNILLSPPIAQRMLISDKKQVRTMWYLCALFLFFILSALLIIALAGIGMGVEVDTTNVQSITTLFVRTARALFTSQWAQDFVFLGILAVTISTIDSFFHTLGISFVQDFISPLRRLMGMNLMEDKERMNWSKISILSISSVTLVVGYFSQSSLEMQSMFDYAMIIFSIVLYPLIFGIIGIKTDRRSWLSFIFMYVLSTGVVYRMGLYNHDTYFYHCFVFTNLCNQLISFVQTRKTLYTTS